MVSAVVAASCVRAQCHPVLGGIYVDADIVDFQAIKSTPLRISVRMSAIKLQIIPHHPWPPFFQSSVSPRRRDDANIK